MKKTTRADFALFKRTFRKCVQKWGLTDWEIYFTCESLRNFAEITINHTTRVAEVRLDSEMSEFEYDGFDPAASAKHEAIHLLISPLECVAMSRYTTEAALECQTERIVRQLEKIIA